MQDILSSFDINVQRRKAMIFTVLVLAYLAIYVWMGSSGEASEQSITQISAVVWLMLQGLLSGVFFVLLPLLLIRFALNKPISEMLLSIDYKSVLYVFVIGISSMVVLSAVVEWNAGLAFPWPSFQEWARAKEDELKIFTEHLLDFKSVWQYVIGIVVVGAIAAVGEELLFRGLLQNLLNRWVGNAHMAIWLSAILFSAIHLQFFGFFPRVLLGALFGYMYWWSGNLTVPILGHFLHNSLSLTFAYVAHLQPGGLTIEPDKMDQSAPWHSVLLFLVIGAYFIYKFQEHQRHVARRI